MLVHACATSCWVVGSSPAVAVRLSLSARRDSDRASRSTAVIAFADAGVRPVRVVVGHATESATRGKAVATTVGTDLFGHVV